MLKSESAESKKALKAWRKDYYHRKKDVLRANQIRSDKKRRSENPQSFWVAKAWSRAKTRAKASGLPCEVHVIELPEVCPILGVFIDYSTTGEGIRSNSPSLDKVIPELGYVAGNVRVISYRANTMKSDMTVAQAEALLAYMKGQK